MSKTPTHQHSPVCQVHGHCVFDRTYCPACDGIRPAPEEP